MDDTVLSLLLAFLGYSILNIGQAGQKIGLAKRFEEPAAGWTVWGIATAATFISVLIVYIAISFGSVSLVGAMTGSGLASLTIFSRFVMKEKITGREGTALFLIVAAAVLIGVFRRPLGGTEPSYTALYLFFGIGIGIYLTLTILSWKKKLFGMVLGSFAGFLGGFSTIFQKVTTAEAANIFFHDEGVVAGFFHAIKNPLTAVWILLSVASMIILQFSYKGGKAIRIIPAFTVNFILAPVLGGLIVFSESLFIVQWIGIIIMVIGSVLITVTREEKTKTSD